VIRMKSCKLPEKCLHNHCKNGSTRRKKSPTSGGGEVTVGASQGEKEKDGEREISGVDTNHEKHVDEEDDKYFSFLRLKLTGFEHIDESAYLQFMADEEHAREVEKFFWEKALPVKQLKH
jgi:hypothetical protein